MITVQHYEVFNEKFKVLKKAIFVQKVHTLSNDVLF